VNKKIALLLAFVMLTTLVGCGKKNNEQPARDITATEAPAPTKTDGGTAVTDTPVTAVPTPSDVPQPTDAPEPTDEPAPTDEPQAGDTDNIDDDTLKLLTAYNNKIDDLVWESGDSYYHFRFSLGRIDDDDIPELITSYGGMHDDMSFIYTYKDNGSVDWVGNIGSYGSFRYQPGQNYVVAESSSTEQSSIAFYSMNGTKTLVLGTMLYAEYPSDEEAYYYIYENNEDTEVDMETFFARMNELDPGMDPENDQGYFGYYYDGAQPYADYALTDRIGILYGMYEAAMAGENYGGNLPVAFADLAGDWGLREYFTYNTSDATGNSSSYSEEDAYARVFVGDENFYIRVDEVDESGLDIEFTLLRSTYFAPSLRDDMMNNDYCYRATGVDGVNVFPIYISDYTDADRKTTLEVLLIKTLEDGSELQYHFEFDRDHVY
jgi:hypothetical protein